MFDRFAVFAIMTVAVLPAAVYGYPHHISAGEPPSYWFLGHRSWMNYYHRYHHGHGEGGGYSGGGGGFSSGGGGFSSGGGDYNSGTHDIGYSAGSEQVAYGGANDGHHNFGYNGGNHYIPSGSSHYIPNGHNVGYNGGSHYIPSGHNVGDTHKIIHGSGVHNFDHSGSKPNIGYNSGKKPNIGGGHSVGSIGGNQNIDGGGGGGGGNHNVPSGGEVQNVAGGDISDNVGISGDNRDDEIDEDRNVDNGGKFIVISNGRPNAGDSSSSGGGGGGGMKDVIKDNWQLSKPTAAPPLKSTAGKTIPSSSTTTVSNSISTEATSQTPEYFVFCN